VLKSPLAVHNIPTVPIIAEIALLEANSLTPEYTTFTIFSLSSGVIPTRLLRKLSTAFNAPSELK